MGHVIQKTPFRTTRHIALMLLRLVIDKMKPILAELPGPPTTQENFGGPALFSRSYHVTCPMTGGDALLAILSWAETQDGQYFTLSYVLDESSSLRQLVDMTPLYVLKFELGAPPLSELTYLESTADRIVENLQQFFTNEGLVPALALGKGFKGPNPVDMSFLQDLGPEPQPA